MKLFLILLTVISFGAFGSVSNVMLDGSIANTGIETIRGSSVPIGRNKVMLPADFNNLLLNSSFEAQNATEGWTVTSLATATASTSDVFEGKKKVCISGVGSIYQLLDDTDKFHGRKFIARLNVQNPNDDGGKVCLYDGDELYKCVNTKPSDEFVEYVLSDTFIQGKTYGIIYNSNTLNNSCIDKASIKLDANEAYVAEIEGDWENIDIRHLTIGNMSTSTDLSTFTVDRREGNSKLISLSSSGVKVTRDADVWVTFLTVGSTGGQASSIINLNGILKAGSVQTSGAATQSSVTSFAKMGINDAFTFQSSYTSGSARISILAKARSQVINYPDETFSTDINPVYWKATPCGDDEIGCYNTYEYAAGSNIDSICSTRPTQTDADIRVNGFYVTLRQKISDPASCASAPRIEMVVPKNSFYRHTVYKDTSRSAFSDGKLFAQSASSLIGFRTIEGNPETGRFIIDSGAIFGGGDITTNRINYSDNSATTSGYVVVKASKTGAVLANKPPRELVKIVENGDGWAHIYSDGWVEQNVVGVSQDVAANSGSGQSLTLMIPVRSTSSGTPFSLNPYSTGSGRVPITSAFYTSTTQVQVGFWNLDSVTRNAFPRLEVKTYGAASYLLENYGIKVNY